MEEGIWPLVSQEAKDLIENLLNKVPSKRINITDAANHAWFKTSTADNLANNEQFAKIYENIKNHNIEHEVQHAVLNFIIHHHHVNLDEVKILREYFVKFDVNKDGYLNLEELLNGLTIIMTHSEAKQQATVLMETMDVEKDGKLSYEEFLNASINKNKIINDSNLVEVFNIIDKNKNGSICKKELKEFFLGIKCDSFIEDNLFENFITELDVNGHGEINPFEFQNLMYKVLNMILKKKNSKTD